MRPETIPAPLFCEPEQSAVIPYRVRPGGVEVLLVTTRGRRRWIVPKGNVEPELGPAASAAKEAFEEAGVRGEVTPEPIGHYRHGRSKKAPAVAVYAMRVDVELDEWPEDDFRRRRWVPLEQAVRLVGVRGVQAVMRGMAAVLGYASAVAPAAERVDVVAAPGGRPAGAT